MATGADVLTMLIPTGGWSIQGDDFDTVNFIEATPITKKQFEDGFAAFDAWKTQQNSAQAAAKDAAQAKLAALGLTTDDLKALGLGGN
jgi:hypothetical protein